MKGLREIVFLATLCLVSLSAYAQDQDLGAMYLRLVEGDVQIKPEDTGEWVPAAANTPLLAGDRIWSPQGGRAEIQIKDGSVVRLDAVSLLEISALDGEGERLFLAGGHFYVSLSGPKGRGLVVEAPGSTLHPYGQSAFGVDVSDQGDTEVSVLKGEVFVDRDRGEMRIAAGERYLFRKEGGYPEVVRRSLPDEWERWNMEQDGALYGPATAYSRQYLPEELAPSAADLDRNGRWVYTQDYGYAWTPTTALNADWSPYSVGRWVWMGSDYVWVSYEPWGWAPYHYGRWTHVRPMGWCWVPPARGYAYWAPGYVAWVQTPTHISWVPLAPREIYYGRGYYGPHSVNIAKVTITSPSIGLGTLYKNVRVNNAVTSVSRDAFLRGSSMQARGTENPFLQSRTVTPAVQLQPMKSTRMPAVKEIASANRPPDRTEALVPARPQLRSIAGTSASRSRDWAGVRPGAGRPRSDAFLMKRQALEASLPVRSARADFAATTFQQNSFASRAERPQSRTAELQRTEPLRAMERAVPRLQPTNPQRAWQQAQPREPGQGVWHPAPESAPRMASYQYREQPQARPVAVHAALSGPAAGRMMAAVGRPSGGTGGASGRGSSRRR